MPVWPSIYYEYELIVLMYNCSSLNFLHTILILKLILKENVTRIPYFLWISFYDTGHWCKTTINEFFMNKVHPTMYFPFR